MRTRPPYRYRPNSQRRKNPTDILIGYDVSKSQTTLGMMMARTSSTSLYVINRAIYTVEKINET